MTKNTSLTPNDTGTFSQSTNVHLPPTSFCSLSVGSPTNPRSHICFGSTSVTINITLCLFDVIAVVVCSTTDQVQRKKSQGRRRRDRHAVRTGLTRFFTNGPTGDEFLSFSCRYRRIGAKSNVPGDIPIEINFGEATVDNDEEEEDEEDIHTYLGRVAE